MTFIEFIIPTFHRPNELKCLLYSLVSQKDEDWTAHVVIDNPNDKENKTLVKEMYDNRIYYSLMEKRYNDWGHSLRQYAKEKSKSQYVVLTCDDNYYMPTFVSEVKFASKEFPGMVYCDMIHSHYKYHYFKCVPAFNQIDMGAFAIRTELAKQITMKTVFAADGLFVEDFKTMFPNEKMIRIDKVLFVHN